MPWWKSISEEAQHMIQSPTQSKSSWFLQDVASSFKENAPSYISIIALVSAIGLAHNWFLHRSAASPNSKNTITHKLARQYSCIAQCIVGAMSFMNVIDKPHLQQILSTALLFAFNISQFAPQLFQWINANRGTSDNALPSSDGMAMDKQKASNFDHDADEKDDSHQHQRGNKDKPATLYQSKDNATSRPAAKVPFTSSAPSAMPKQRNEMSTVARLILTWVKNAVLSYGASLPTLLVNNSHISRLKSSLLNPLSWFTSTANEYSAFNPFSLSLVNMVGAGFALFAIAWVVYQHTLANNHQVGPKKANNFINNAFESYMPAWYNNITNYALFTAGIFLSAFRLGAPMTWLSVITPIGSGVAAIIRLLKNYQDSNKPVPSLIKKIEKQNWARDVITMTDKFLPGVVV